MSNVERLKAKIVKLTNVSIIATLLAAFLAALAVAFTHAGDVMLERGQTLLHAAVDRLEELIPVSLFIRAIVMVWGAMTLAALSRNCYD